MTANGNPPPYPTHPTHAISRRDLLRSGGLLAATMAAGGLLTACSGSTDTAAKTTAKKGGVLRVAATGGSAKDSLDPHNPLTYPDQARVLSLYEPLFFHDAKYRLKPLLAQSIEPSKDGMTWTLRLRDGVEFHNGKTLGADDVIASLRRIMNPKSPAAGATSLAVIDAARLKKLDARTVRITLKHPYALLQDLLAQYSLGIVPADFDITKPVGTGPFAYKSFDPGNQSTFTRFAGYWQRPAYVDQLDIIDFADDTAKVNALLSGQVDALDNLPQSQIKVIEAQGGKVLVSETGAWTPITMRVDTGPFRDARVRQAFRLIVDRPQMVSQVLNGQGRIGNDLYAPFDPAYNDALPQRAQDLAQAKSLLKAAGHDGLTVELATSSGIGSGAVEAAQLFAEQAKGAGVTVKVRTADSSTFYGDQYLSWPFAEDYWFTRNYLPQVNQGSVKAAPYNETHWNDPEFVSLIDQASRQFDAGKRDELLKAAQKIEYESGGYIVWGFKNQVDAYAAGVSGFTPDRNLPLSNYQFRNVSVSG
ncbi:MAG: peptide/nickel transport system substrate-binding protein [Streptomyces sp.]|jgi:peptide/nickel transport system substrate-binding protein|nr:peptide/nickel transport system substrate-binding protein [Streptomyces sp.]MDX6350390.1 peptide/nickel transport system substrate-binding protein [Streptomyces sp.]